MRQALLLLVVFAAVLSPQASSRHRLASRVEMLRRPPLPVQLAGGAAWRQRLRLLLNQSFYGLLLIRNGILCSYPLSTSCCSRRAGLESNLLLNRRALDLHASRIEHRLHHAVLKHPSATLPSTSIDLGLMFEDRAVRFAGERTSTLSWA